MVLTPLDIHNKEFGTKMKGYNPDEVNDFLDQIIKDYEIVLKEKRNLEKNLEFCEEKLNHYSAIENTLNKSIIVAQDAADEVRSNADKEAKMIIMEAEKNADRILNDSLTKAQHLSTETTELKKQTRLFRQRLQLMIESQLDLVKSNEWDEVTNIVNESFDEAPVFMETIKELENKKAVASGETVEEEAEVAPEAMKEEPAAPAPEPSFIVEKPVFNVTEEEVTEQPYMVEDGKLEAVDASELSDTQVFDPIDDK